MTEIKAELRDLLGRLKADGKRIAAYGASAKGSTLLNYCGIGRETLDFVADRSTGQAGAVHPGHPAARSARRGSCSTRCRTTRCC